MGRPGEGSHKSGFRNNGWMARTRTWGLLVPLSQVQLYSTRRAVVGLAKQAMTQQLSGASHY